MLSEKVLNEICRILKKEGRDDLVAVLVEENDLDYKPPKYVKSDYYSNDEGTASSESEYEFETDEEGFMSIKQ
tara:strand:- start:3296 stop:3514 length:219 start_codon:yes stop_codon:yes gene_type:complete